MIDPAGLAVNSGGRAGLSGPFLRRPRAALLLERPAEPPGGAPLRVRRASVDNRLSGDRQRPRLAGGDL
jgi:hypothetical protein